MNKRFYTCIFAVLLLTPLFLFAQNGERNTKETKVEPKEETQKEDGKDKEPKTRDFQNQIQFFKPDIESQLHNFYRRREISTPLQPRYDTDSAVYQRGKKRQKQQQAYLNNQYFFPARPRDQWELGINFGSAFVSGDVRPYVNIRGLIQNIGAGVTIRKALGYSFSLRFGYNYFLMTGRNWEPDENLEFNGALRGRYDSRVNYWNNPRLLASNTTDSLNMNKMFFYNYRTYMHEVNFNGVVNLGNIRFHKERTIVNFYLTAGASAFIYTTYMDALNENGDVHDFSHVHRLYYDASFNPDVNAAFNFRKEALKRLNNILDGKYESFAERENNVWGRKGWAFIPTGNVGAGVQFHATKWFTVGIEQRAILGTSDLLDGYRWQQDVHDGFTREWDNVMYTSINLLFNLGKKRTAPMYWLNPVHHTYKKLGEVNPASIAEDLKKDDDDDGVPNWLDKEPNTKKDCPVDTKGRSLDSDKDGIVDCDDKEPFSAPGYPVDSFGVAIIPPNPCCDTVGRGEGDGSDLPGTGGRSRRSGTGYDCSKIELPSIVFDEDKYYLDPQYYGTLHMIAERMQMCPDMKLVVTGYDESRNDQKYNEQLAWNRANAAVDYLVEKYGISRDRFIVKYQGGKKAATGTPYERKMKNKVEFRYANEGETGSSNPPAPHPGLKAGSNK
ncbi:MAG: OmpA family protein [Chitinophagales bacterium]|nr:OmpA family protein [Chitinophagales bacterium]MDW8419104.1 OmpA family protein [Chitinophagales bacterium]